MVRNESLQTGRKDGVDVARREEGGVQEGTWELVERPEQRACQGVCFCRGEKQAGWVSAQEIFTRKALLLRLHHHDAARELDLKRLCFRDDLKTLCMPPPIPPPSGTHFHGAAPCCTGLQRIEMIAIV